MKTALAIVGGAVAIVGLVALIAVLGGTLVWLTWPVAIPAAFPGLVASGTLAASLTWWQSVCLAWLAGCLVKTTQTNNNSGSK